MGALALLEVIDRDGHVRQAWPIRAWPARIGRALDNDVVLTDPHVAAHHFSLDDSSAQGLVLDTGQTVNGVAVGSKRIPGATHTVLGRDSGPLEFVAGHTRLRLRRAESVLAPEVPLSEFAVRHLRSAPTLGLGALLLAGLVFNTYLDTDPDGFVRAAGSMLLAALSAAAVWCGAWALLSKTITRQGHFGWHLRVFVITGLGLLALAAVPGLLAFALSMPWLSDFSFIATYALGATALYFHLLAVEPTRPRLLRAVVASGALAGVALTILFNLQRNSRIDDELYMSHLFPPAVRLARPMAPERFVNGLAPLRAVLDQRINEGPNADDGAPARNGSDDED